MQESSEDFGEQDEDTEIQNFPLHTERNADGIYRYYLTSRPFGKPDHQRKARGVPSQGPDC